MRVRITLLILIALLLAACGGASGSTGAAPASEPEPTTTPVSEEPTNEAAPTVAAEPAVDVDCPSAPVIPDLAPVDGASDFPPEGSGLPAGKYGSTRLGVSFAIDVPDGFDEAGSFGDNIALFGPWDQTIQVGAIVAITRPEGYVARHRTEEEVARGEPRTIVDLDTWLAETGVGVLSDAMTTVAGRDAREVRFTVAPDLVTNQDIGDVPVTPDVGAQPGDHEHLIVEVGLEVGAPLVVYAEGPGDDFPAVADAMVGSLEIGDVDQRPAVIFAETPWDSGNVFRAVTVDACPIPAVAFDGVVFDLSSPAKIMGTGDELWIFEAEGRHVGFREPYVNLVRPDTTATGGSFGPPSPGDVVATIDDALTEFEAEGFALEPLGDVGTLLGAPAVGFDFIIETAQPWLWFPRGHSGSAGLGFASDEGEWQGTMYLAEVGDGVVIVSAGAEIGTDDVDLVRPLFDDIVASLRAAD